MGLFLVHVYLRMEDLLLDLLLAGLLSSASKTETIYHFGAMFHARSDSEPASSSL
jgi:hypothetical protein